MIKKLKRIFKSTIPQQKVNLLVHSPWVGDSSKAILVKKLAFLSQDYGWNMKVTRHPIEFGELLMSKLIPTAIVVMNDIRPIEIYLDMASDQGIPIIGMDSMDCPYLTASVSSNNASMARESAAYLAAETKGEIVIIGSNAHPMIYERELVARFEFATHSHIEVSQTLDYDNSLGHQILKKKLADVIKSDKGEQISGVWSAWDRPTLVITKMIDKLGYSERIKVAGVDGTKGTLALLKSSRSLIATSAQDLDGIALSTPV
ncbi:hypothetical protein A140_18915 [Vibrio crassostreae 9ZC88]|nr:hypothetical protein A140_18915 [Vibrio crassostreae 9ZC88]